MSPKSLSVKVSPATLRWARASAGVTIDEVAARLHTDAAAVSRWETGEEEPTLGALEKLSRLLRRPLAILLLPEPPQEAALPSDFRVLPGTLAAPLSRKSRLAIRRAQRLQRLSRELLSELGIEHAPNVEPAHLDSDPEELAARERVRFGISLQEQSAWGTVRDAFAAWRRAIESRNTLVFRFPMPVRECRGFSLTADEPPVIVVNSSDSVSAANFTLFHEYAHVLLRAGGICLVEDADDDNGLPVERFCDRFAGAFLVPREALLKDSRLGRSVDPAALPDEDILAIAARFRVSRFVVWRRMLETHLLPTDAYWERVRRWQAEPPPVRPRRRGGPRPANRCVQERGRRFASLVLEARNREVITHRDAMDYLSVAPQHIGKVEALLRGGRAK